MKIQIFFEKGDTKIAKAIRWFGKLKTGDAKVSHVGFVIEDAYTIESLFIRGVAHRAWDKIKKEGTLLYDISNQFIPDVWKTKLIIELNNMVGSPLSGYGLYKIPLQAADSLLSLLLRRPAFLFTGSLGVKYFPICSSLVGWALKNNSPEHGDIFKDWRGLSPDDVHDIVKANPDFFKEEVVA